MTRRVDRRRVLNPDAPFTVRTKTWINWVPGVRRVVFGILGLSPRALWIDQDPPHLAACRRHKGALGRPALMLDPDAWRRFAMEHGRPWCEVEGEGSQ